MIATRDIRAGEELCICYIDAADEEEDGEEADAQPMTRAERHLELRDYLFVCECERCVEELVNPPPARTKRSAEESEGEEEEEEEAAGEGEGEDGEGEGEGEEEEEEEEEEEDGEAAPTKPSAAAASKATKLPVITKGGAKPAAIKPFTAASASPARPVVRLAPSPAANSKSAAAASKTAPAKAASSPTAGTSPKPKASPAPTAAPAAVAKPKAASTKPVVALKSKPASKK
jgi:hypothetical protein